MGSYSKSVQVMLGKKANLEDITKRLNIQKKQIWDQKTRDVIEDSKVSHQDNWLGVMPLTKNKNNTEQGISSGVRANEYNFNLLHLQYL